MNTLGGEHSGQREQPVPRRQGGSEQHGCLENSKQASVAKSRVRAGERNRE